MVEKWHEKKRNESEILICDDFVVHVDHVNCMEIFFFTLLVFLANLFFFGWCRVIFDVECFVNFIWYFSLDHVCHGLASHIQQAFGIQIVWSQTIFIPRQNLDLLFIVILIFNWNSDGQPKPKYDSRWVNSHLAIPSDDCNFIFGVLNYLIWIGWIEISLKYFYIFLLS